MVLIMYIFSSDALEFNSFFMSFPKSRIVINVCGI